MIIVQDITGPQAAQLRGGAVSIGNFDGVHRGHERILATLGALAGRVGGPAVVFTFEPHPVELLRPGSHPPPLTWFTRKAELLAAAGVDVLVVYPTDRELLSWEPERFFAQVVRAELAARAMVEGPNFFFGRDRRGDVDLLRTLCREAEMTLEIVTPLEMDGQYVSSSRIRAALQAGEVAEAARHLGRPHRVRGRVSVGAQRGAGLGFPTANLAPVENLVPAPGVYAGRVTNLPRPRLAAIHVGGNPTFSEAAGKVEVHLLDFQGDLYGQPLEVEFVDRLRGITKFAGPEELVAQLERDCLRVRELLD